MFTVTISWLLNTLCTPMNYCITKRSQELEGVFIIQVSLVLNNYFLMTDWFTRREHKELMIRYSLPVHVLQIYVYCFLLLNSVSCICSLYSISALAQRHCGLTGPPMTYHSLCSRQSLVLSAKLTLQITFPVIFFKEIKQCTE